MIVHDFNLVRSVFTPDKANTPGVIDPDAVLTLSLAFHNAKTALLICCPMTTQIEGYPFEVIIAGAPPGAALADQVKNLDWVACKARHKGKVSAEELAEVRAKMVALIGN